MNIGHLKNQPFVETYKTLGFSTRNQMIDAALELLKKSISNERREKWRKAAHKEYAQEHVWESIEGEEFESP